jgi:glutathione synthase/RimK-type ligase-like ATP-grasp enzyme
MKTLALLVTHDYYPSRPDRPDPDYVSKQLGLLQAACAPYEIEIKPVFWQDEGNDWASYDAVSPLLAWSYPKQTAMFLARLDEIEAAGVPLLNPAYTVRANMDKGYLADLAAKGAPVPETLALDTCTHEAILASFETLACEEIIIKPRIGAGAWRQARLKRGQAIPAAEELPPAGALIQPFLPSVTRQGELSMVYFGGVFSHALMKAPKEGDYRTQGQHGAIETSCVPDDKALAAAELVLNKALGEPTLYARVDLVAGPDGNWLLMELELIEPWLYLALDGQNGRKGAAGFAQALAATLASATVRHND